MKKSLLIDELSFFASNRVYDFSYRYIDPCLRREIEIFAQELQRGIIEHGCKVLNEEMAATK